jgi:A118 family predicted phage portal protein
MKNMEPIPIDFSLRVTDITASIQTALNILSIQVGFSAGYLTFDAAAQAVTATQVISEQSKTFKTKVKYENAIDDGIRTLLTAIQSIGAAYGMDDISGKFDIQWNDNIIEDRNSKTDYWIKRYQNKICTLQDVLMHVDDLSEEDAVKKAAEINKQNATIPSLSDIMGGAGNENV